MNSILLTTTYQQVAVAKAVFIGQARVKAEVFVGNAPSPSDLGFAFSSDIPQTIPELTALGGEVWVRGEGTFVYATD